MHFGTYMGIYWVAKFILLPLGMTNSLLMFLFVGLTIAVPFVGYYYARSFRDKICGGSITFIQSWVFMIFMYLFASLLVAVAHYIYFRYIDNGYMVDAYEAAFEQIKNMPEMAATLEQYPYQEAVDTLRALTPIEITMQFLSSNMLFCSILSLITAPFIARKKEVTP